MRPTPRWLRHVDQYYWFTAYLAARGAQEKASRLIAAMIFGLGVIPLILIGSPVGPEGPRDRLLAVVVTVGCLLMALRWLSRRWPTRTESILCVMTGTTCIAVACLIPANPFYGLFGATSFAVLAAYIVLFHTARLLLITWTVAGAVLVILAMTSAEQDAALALCVQGTKAACTIPQLVKLLGEKHKSTSWEQARVALLLRAIAGQGAEAREALPALVRLWKNEAIRVAVDQALAALDPADRPTFTDLIPLLKDETLRPRVFRHQTASPTR